MELFFEVLLTFIKIFAELFLSLIWGCEEYILEALNKNKI